VRRGLTQRTVLASIVIAVVVLGEFAVLFLAFQSLRAEERQDNQAVNVLATSSALEESLLNLSTGLRIYLMSGQPAGLRPYQAALAAYPRQARQLDRLTAGNPDLHGRVASLGNSIEAYVGLWTSAIIQMSRVDLPRRPAPRCHRRGQGAGGADPGSVRGAGPSAAGPEHCAPG
jgi:CHASE3 domain sensor protein